MKLFTTTEGLQLSHIVKKSETELRLGALLRLSFQMKIAKKERVQFPWQFSSKQVFHHFVKGQGAGIWHLVDTNWIYSPQKQAVLVWDPTFCLSPMRSHISSCICNAISHWLWLRLGSCPWQSLQSFSEDTISVVLHSYTLRFRQFRNKDHLALVRRWVAKHNFNVGYYWSKISSELHISLSRMKRDLAQHSEHSIKAKAFYAFAFITHSNVVRKYMWRQTKLLLKDRGRGRRREVTEGKAIYKVEGNINHPDLYFFSTPSVDCFSF